MLFTSEDIACSISAPISNRVAPTITDYRRKSVKYATRNAAPKHAPRPTVGGFGVAEAEAKLRRMNLEVASQTFVGLNAAP